MRSYLATLFLLITSLIAVGMASMYFREGDLSRIFGQPTTPIGEPLYRFNPEEVTDIYLAGNGVGAHCRHTEADGWQMIAPWKDRMDSRAAQRLMAFMLGTRVEGGIPTDKFESSAIGVEDGKSALRGKIELRVSNKADDPLAKFWIGHRTPWFGTDSESGETIPTVFVTPRDRSRKDYVYACTDRENILELLGDGFRRLRDHHPFLFHPYVIGQVRIKSDQGELLLTQKAKGEWHITKPLDLNPDSEKILSLLQGLYDLEAVRVHNRDEITLPSENSQAHRQVGLRFLTTGEEVVLDIYPPETEVSQTVMATVSDRPNTVFELPLVKPANPDIKVALNELPLSVNALRDPTLTSITPAGIRSILISPASGEDLLITRPTPTDRFGLRVDDRLEEPNEQALFTLLKTVSEAKVSEFVSDTATDLSPYGLNQPFLVLRFSGFDNSVIELRFGEAPDGQIHAMRAGTTTVVKIDSSLLQVIPTQIWEWRSPELWRISQPDVLGIGRRIGGQPPLQLLYDFASERWTVDGGDPARSADLNTGRAGQLLKHLLDPKVTNWLPPGQVDPTTIFASPDVFLELLVKDIDDQGKLQGVKRIQLAIKGRVGATSARPDTFLINGPFLDQLTVDLFSFD
ncbi:hypothetical protein HNR46_000325 [Haloferula luteola]|uniref:DUF4340 domain-containing protein n=1 Tax=Haloferula luteola TaxID=595692 RepID=A0A840V367_9BACT|nr:DUF4340 domain-containing protein [Haloferula luteola]MBB5350104.1 hypothetical protein [Haloferula luteola]